MESTGRRVAYFFLTLGLVFALYALAERYHEMTFREFGIVENIQFSLLLLSAGGFVADAFLIPKQKPLFLFLASLCMLGACREMDSFFDFHLPIVSWKFGFLFPCAALLNLYRHRKNIRASLFYFMETSAFNLMFTAVIIGLALAQALGHRSFIATVLGTETHARAVRRILEEGAEVVAYFLILLSTIECYFNFRKRA